MLDIKDIASIKAILPRTTAERVISALSGGSGLNAKYYFGNFIQNAAGEYSLVEFANTLGAVGFQINATGNYDLTSNGLFTYQKTFWMPFANNYNNAYWILWGQQENNENELELETFSDAGFTTLADFGGSGTNGEVYVIIVVFP